MSLTLSHPNQEREIRNLAKVRKEAPEKVLSDLVGEALSQKKENGQAPGETRKEQEAAWEEFLASMADWSKTLPPGHGVDDSRESIYAGRGE